MAQLHGFIRPPTWWTISSTTWADFKRSYSLSEAFCFISSNVRSLALGLLHYPPFVILYQLGTKNQFVKNRTNTICVFY